LPLIGDLHNRDVVFRQLQDDIAAYHRAVARGQELPPLLLFHYTPANEDLFGLAARLNLPYDAIASLNGLENPSDLGRVRTLMVPNMPGLFVPDLPRTDLEEFLVASSRDRAGSPIPVFVPGGAVPRKYHFFPGERFNPVERAYFLRILFRFPLAGPGRITSPFGMRRDPFSGHERFHEGIDIAAKRGTEVLAAREGTVTVVGEDPVFGLFVVLEHVGGYQTLYGHLDTVLVSLNQRVRSGMIVGTVGVTGLTTGPHLHFEIRKTGGWRDPLPLIRGQNEP
jgi:murein DD-endopeptidase MepM/ murein hydrolase activator NlpD